MTLGAHVRLALWYAAAVGVLSYIPYAAVILADTGLSDGAVAATILLTPIGMLLGGPLWSWVADASGRPHVVLRVATAAAAVAGLLLASLETGAGMALALLMLALARSPQFPVMDALTVELQRDEGRGYGRVRMWGSVAYVLAAFSGGWLRETWPRAPLIIVAALLVLTAAMSWVVPRPPATPLRGTMAALRKLPADPVLIPLLAVAVVHGVTLTAYDNLFSLHVERMGFRSGLIGTAVAVGVIAEIAVMAAGPRLLARIGPARLILIGVASGVPRWLLTGFADSPTVLVAAQALHGLGFGAFWVAGISLLARLAPAGLARSTQSLLPASAFGAGYLASMGLAALLLEPLGTRALFSGLAVVSAAGTLGTLIVVRRVDRRLGREQPASVG